MQQFTFVEEHKENIEPLRDGRSAQKLVRILQDRRRESNVSLDAAHADHRKAISLSTSLEDPLEVYDKYIRWTLEAYPQGHNHESRLVDLLEETVHAFQDDTRYYADVRYLKWCILYARYVETPDDIYMHLFSNGIGIQYSALYEAYCKWLEKSGRLEKATRIYELGLQRDTKPSGRLLKHYNQFRKRKAQSRDIDEHIARVALRSVPAEGLDSRPADMVDRKPKARIEVLSDETSGSENILLASGGSLLLKRQLVRKENVQLPGSAGGSLLPQSSTRTPKTTKIKVFQDKLTEDCSNSEPERLAKLPLDEEDPLLSIEERRAQHRHFFGKSFEDSAADDAMPSPSPSESQISRETLHPYSTSNSEIEDDLRTFPKGFTVPSPTINTKAALADIIDIFSQPLKRLKLDPVEDALSSDNEKIPPQTSSPKSKGCRLFDNDKPHSSSSSTHLDPVSETESDPIPDNDLLTNNSPIEQPLHMSPHSPVNAYTKFQFMTPIQERTEPISEMTQISFLLSPSSEKRSFTPSQEDTGSEEDTSTSSDILDDGRLEESSPPRQSDLVTCGSLVDMRHAIADQMVKLEKMAGDENEPRSEQSSYTLNLGNATFQILKKITEGGFGAVFLATEDGANELETAIKVEKPMNCWEYEILLTSASRLPQSCQNSIIQPINLYAFADESFLVMPYGRFGTLIDLVNVCGPTGLDELLVMFYAIELLRIVENLHFAGIIHGDLKADNCLVRFEDRDEWDKNYLRGAEGGWSAKGICLIDFGRAIDMRAHATGTDFVADWPSDKHDCPEIQEGRSWSYEIDYFGIAAIIHTMLFGCYIEAMPIAQGSRYAITRNLKRYWQTSIWQNLFDVLINVKMLPGHDHDHNVKDLERLREQLEDFLESNHTKNGKSLRGLLIKCEAALLERIVE